MDVWSLGWRLTPPCVAVLLLTTACGSPADQDAERQASILRSAVEDQDGKAACAALSARTASELEQSSGKPCAEAILEEELPTEGEASRVRVFGNMAEVEYDAETIFLSRYPEGWRVSAAGCTPTPAGSTTAWSREAEVRIMFWSYLVVVVVGLAFLLVVTLRNG